MCFKHPFIFPYRPSCILHVSESCNHPCSGCGIPQALLLVVLPVIPRASLAVIHFPVKLVFEISFLCACCSPPFLKLHSCLVVLTFFKSISFHYLHSLIFYLSHLFCFICLFCLEISNPIT